MVWILQRVSVSRVGWGRVGPFKLQTAGTLVGYLHFRLLFTRVFFSNRVHGRDWLQIEGSRTWVEPSLSWNVKSTELPESEVTTVIGHGQDCLVGQSNHGDLWEDASNANLWLKWLHLRFKVLVLKIFINNDLSTFTISPFVGRYWPFPARSICMWLFTFYSKLLANADQRTDSESISAILSLYESAIWNWISLKSAN